MILCLGTTPALQRTMSFDRLRVDAVNRATAVHEYASGKAVNAARVVRTTGQAVLVTGFLGGDSGDACRRDLDAAGIPHDFVPVGSRTRMCVTVVDRGGGTATELIEEPGPVTEGEFAELLDKVGVLLSRTTVMVLSGSLAPGVPAGFYAACVSAARAARVMTIVDAAGEPLRQAIAERPTVVKPNRRELQETTGVGTATPEHVREAVARLFGDFNLDGETQAVVTMGADGAVVSDGSSLEHVVVPKVPVVSPIGSGDALAGGMAAALAGGMPIIEAAVLGCAFGVANAMTELAGHVRMEDVNRVAGEIEVAEG